MLIHDVEIFETGSWPGQGAKGVTFGEAELDQIVASFNTLGLSGRVPLKLGHDGTDARVSDSAPALGWVESIKRAGNKLLADIKLTSDKLAEGIKSGAYKFVSIELLRNVVAHTRQIPWVLDAVALLGATPPAVGTLKSLAESMGAFRAATPAFQFAERLSFSAHGHDDPIEELRRQNAELQRQLREGAFRAATDLAIVQCKVTPADVARFSSIVPPEGRTVAAWQQYSRGIEPPKYRHGNRALSGDGDEARGEGGAGAELNRLTAAYCEDQLLRFGREIQPFEAAPIVWRKHPELTRQWHEERAS